MDLVIFMGHHKVGSSSLQSWLSTNWLALARAGILYPAVEMQGLASNLATALRGEAEPGATNPINVREAHNALAFKMMAESAERREVPPWHQKLPPSGQMIRAIRQQAETIRPRAVVLCSEVFANFAPMPPRLLKRLKTLFPKANVRIVCTLRRPDSYVTSWHGQRLKFGHHLRALREDGLEEHFGSIHFNYRRMLGKWVETFPRAEFALRDYAQVLASGGSVPDFMATSGLEWPEGLVEVADSNPSLPLAAMEIARRGNLELPGGAAKLLREHLIGSGKRLDYVPSAEVEMFGEANRALMLERFAPIDAWLAQVVGRERFFADLEEVGRTRPVPEMEAARAGLELVRADPAFADLRRDARGFVKKLAFA
ncbi:hypothetical protein [Albimonas pacifica]|uniref:Sulfotransferase family protein n=1 Tax=Albimonas pacifica TaxID=1114924 RepID=A0A1I3BWS0_9RHOB|nr:hypothetical protein [Albimonas pacifica]SFH66755.1 hypothetical protein SAMN05216258_101403 [Albimonas pacifica]